MSKYIAPLIVLCVVAVPAIFIVLFSNTPKIPSRTEMIVSEQHFESEKTMILEIIEEHKKDYLNLRSKSDNLEARINSNVDIVNQLSDQINQLSENLKGLNEELKAFNETINSISDRLSVLEGQPTVSADPKDKKTIQALKDKIRKLESDINLFQYQRQHGGIR
jgi:chromosome segregation ATPase